MKHTLLQATLIILAIWMAFLPGCTSTDSKTSQLSTEPDEFRVLEENTIINLYDAFGHDKPGLQKDFGFSCILKFRGQTILFDAGSNADIFRQNVEALNIDLREIDFVVASHAHFDHINGFDHLLEVHPEVPIYFPFDFFWGANVPFNLAGAEASVADSLQPEMRYFDGDFASYSFNQTGRFWNANIEFVRENTEISEGITLITTASPYLGYFNKYPSLRQEGTATSDGDDATANFIELQELSLSLRTDDGEVVIVGCSHSTVETIIAATRAQTENDISLVYGGYHLLPYARSDLQSLAVRLQEEHGVQRVAPAHCTGHLAFRILKTQFGQDYLFAGLGEVTAF